MNASPKSVLVIGGGIAGLAVALFLKQAGFSVEIFEASGGHERPGGALSVGPNGMNVLAAAGVVERVRDVSVVSSEWSFESQHGDVLALSKAEDHRERYGQTGVMITRAALHRVVVERVAARGIPIRFDKRLRSVDDTAGRPIVARFSDGSTAEGDLIVGADGIHSQVRQAVMPLAPKPGYTGMVSPGGFSPSLDANVRPRSDQRTHFVFGRNGFFGYFNAMTADGARTVWWSTSSAAPKTKQEMASTSELEVRQRILALHEDWAAPVPQLIRSATEVLDVAIDDVSGLPSWSAGRTVLIGDAAHAVAPHSGQGASMALEDAMFLAKLLRESRGESLADVFAGFERHRRPRTDKVIALGRRNATHKERMSAFGYWLNLQAIRIYMRVASDRREDWLFGYKVG